jgi:predicted ATPase
MGPIRIAVTGGPGAGKTTLLNELSARGYPVIRDAAREIIAVRKAKGLSPRPAPAEFARRVFDEDVQQYDGAPRDRGPIFFDRCLVDSIGMLAKLNELSPDDVRALLSRRPFCATAFILPPWREIYRTDAERDQTFAEAVSVYGAVRDWYCGCGYDLVEVPAGPVAERCHFVLRTLSSA